MKIEKITLAGNPNVGKSTIFNALTGLRQHTGNWSGKTVENAMGEYTYKDKTYKITDIPGIYSLDAISKDEVRACEGIFLDEHDYIVVVCDATCLERNLNLVLQIMEVSKKVVVCVNLIDEAKRKKIEIDFPLLEKILGVPIIKTSASKSVGIKELKDAVYDYKYNSPFELDYGEKIEKAVENISENISAQIPKRYVALKLLENNKLPIQKMFEHFGVESEKILKSVEEETEKLKNDGIDEEKLKRIISTRSIITAEAICNECVSYLKNPSCNIDRKIDKVLTGKWSAIPIMLIMLSIVFFLTISGANYPSSMLFRIFFSVDDNIYSVLLNLNLPEWICNMLVFGMYRTLAWVVSVMLPPMAIFFPLFTILEDLGYLPRVAFNLDKNFQRCNACGKQALTMCMGFGCNAVGVTAGRIIDSKRERLIAMLTNSFVPCNGRFPTIISIIVMFFSGLKYGIISSLFLTAVIVFGILMTFVSSKILSMTVLKGEPSSFTLELPPFRKPQILKVIVRACFDRTLIVLTRAVIVSAPAGILIWLMANVHMGNSSLISICSSALDPFARIIGLDGVILMAFILGLPANEIVIPIIIMSYMSGGHITEMSNLCSLKDLLLANGWTYLTAICTVLFSLMHWPCSTTCITLFKETKSIKWTLVGFLLPTIFGILTCFIVATVYRLITL